jgi:hypothetical protein
MVRRLASHHARCALREVLEHRAVQRQALCVSCAPWAGLTASQGRLPHQHVAHVQLADMHRLLGRQCARLAQLARTAQQSLRQLRQCAFSVRLVLTVTSHLAPRRVHCVHQADLVTLPA